MRAAAYAVTAHVRPPPEEPFGGLRDASNAPGALHVTDTYRSSGNSMAAYRTQCIWRVMDPASTCTVAPQWRFGSRHQGSGSRDYMSAQGRPAERRRLQGDADVRVVPAPVGSAFGGPVRPCDALGPAPGLLHARRRLHALTGAVRPSQGARALRRSARTLSVVGGHCTLPERGEGCMAVVGEPNPLVGARCVSSASFALDDVRRPRTSNHRKRAMPSRTVRRTSTTPGVRVRGETERRYGARPRRARNETRHP